MSSKILEAILDKARGADVRLLITFQGQWGTYEESGYVGKSTGSEPCYLLLHNSRSTGGSPVSVDKIARIRESKFGGKTLFSGMPARNP